MRSWRRELAAWMGTEDALVFTTGYQANLGAIGTLLGPGDTASSTRATTRRSSTACRSRARSSRRSATTGSTCWSSARRRRSRTAAGSSSSSTASSRWKATSRRCREIADLAQRHGARLIVDEAHGARRARRARRRRGELLGVEDHVDLRMATFSKSLASWAASRRPGRRDRLPADPVAAVPVHRLGRAGRGRRRARGDADLPLGRGARAVRARARRTREYLDAGCASSASTSSTGRAAGRHAVATPIVPVLVGDDWKAALLWKALYEAGVYVNVALHPAVPPGGALLRTSVMATHDARDARRGARGVRRGQARVRGRARAAARRRADRG